MVRRRVDLFDRELRHTVLFLKPSSARHRDDDRFACSLQGSLTSPIAGA
jgi:hypothetical protein